MANNENKINEIPQDTIINNNNTQTNMSNIPFRNENNNLFQNNPQNNQEQTNTEKKEEVKKQRKIYVDLQDDTEVKQEEKFCDNSVRTTQYTLLSFFPLALLNQYKNPFNIFFLV